MMTSRAGVVATTTASTQSVAAVLLLLGALVPGVYGVARLSLPALLAGAVIGAVALFLLPRNALPPLALWVLVLFPVAYMPEVPRIIGANLLPASLIIAIWMVRLALVERMTLLLRAPIRGWLIAGPLLVLLFASAVFTVDIERTLTWTAVFVVCVVAPALLGQICLDDVWPAVRRTLAGIGLFLGVLAASDFFLHFNPWRLLYEVDRSWASAFRTSTSLGHPLTTALVAGVALAVCVFPTSETRQWPYWICAVGASVALILTVSRSNVFAVGLSAITGVLSARFRTGKTATRGRLIPLLLAATIFAAVALSPLLSQRNASAEGRSSATYRSQLFDAAMGLVGEHPLLGFGPGTSGVLYEYSSYDSLENSALQLMVSTGIPAFLFFLVGLGMVVIVAMRRSRAGVAAGIVAFWISAVGFNVIDSKPGFMVLIAPIIVCAVAPGRAPSAQLESGPKSLGRTGNQPASDHWA
jgi:O-antigen ligase